MLQNAAVGDVVPFKLSTAKFGRVAAQNAKQAIRTELKGFEREKYINQFSDKIHEAVSATVLRVEPESGNDVHVSLDINIQSYATQLAMQAMETKQADSVSILVMNPQNGEILAMVNAPEFNLNDPFTLNTGESMDGMSEQQKQDALNQMWRNQCVNDTYEPGSTFKVFTSSAALMSGTSTIRISFPARDLRSWRTEESAVIKQEDMGGQDFTHAIMNSCNPYIQ